ncbi:MAG: hypothetical protein KGL39_53745 [Patescibacteria group bacterium]|nr:hypothetical protein [Patescibacteria group bacterium]
MRGLTTLLSLCLSASAADVTLSWSPSTSTNVTNYRIYGWTNLPDANCAKTNAVEVLQVGDVTNATLTGFTPAQWTFAATAVETNATTTNESDFSNFAHWEVLPPPTYLVTVQSATNLLGPWTNTQMLFRLKITQ